MSNEAKISLLKRIKQTINENKEEKMKLAFFKEYLTERAFNEFKTTRKELDNERLGLLDNLSQINWCQSSDETMLYSLKTSAHLVLSENGYVIPNIEQKPEVIKEEEDFLKAGVSSVTANSLFKLYLKNIEYHAKDWEVKPSVTYNFEQYKEFVDTAHNYGYMQDFEIEELEKNATK